MGSVIGRQLDRDARAALDPSNCRARARPPNAAASRGLAATNRSWAATGRWARAPPSAAPAAAAVVFSPALMVNTWARASAEARFSRVVNSAPGERTEENSGDGEQRGGHHQ
jgi:hypothetical protein